jgi:tetratricopeptide (TPR) repeat protein
MVLGFLRKLIRPLEKVPASRVETIRLNEPAYDKAAAFDGWFNKGVTLAGVERFDEALEAYDQALEIDPDYAEAWFDKGVALDGLGQHDEAKRAHQHFQQIDTTRPAP